MDTKSKSTAGKQVIGFLCFVMSFSIFFSVGLLLLEQPVYGDGRFVLSEAFDGDVQSTQPVSYTHLDVYKRQGTG